MTSTENLKKKKTTPKTTINVLPVNILHSIIHVRKKIYIYITRTEFYEKLSENTRGLKIKGMLDWKIRPRKFFRKQKTKSPC